MIINAKIIGPVTDPAKYRRQDCEHGEKGYAMSQSDIKIFESCPSKWVKGSKLEPTDDKTLGSAVDCLILTPKQFADRFAITPESYPTEPKKGAEVVYKPWNGNATYCQEWKAEQLGAGKEILRSSEFEKAQAMVNALNADPDIVGFLEGAQTQVEITAEWADKETDLIVPLRGMVDIVPPEGSKWGKSLGDLKTTGNAHPSAFAKHVFDFGWHIQAFLYLKIFQLAGQDRCDFRHVIVENEWPYQTARRWMSQEFIEDGERRFNYSMARYCQCLATGEWPDYERNNTRATVIDGWSSSDVSPWMLAV